jgi:hypothetical protein
MTGVLEPWRIADQITDACQWWRQSYKTSLPRGVQRAEGFPVRDARKTSHCVKLRLVTILRGVFIKSQYLKRWIELRAL